MIRSFVLGACLALCAGPAIAAAKVLEVRPGVWLIEDHSLPIVTVKIAYEQGGSAYDPAGKEGLASFAAQMLSEGAGDMDSLAFSRALDTAAIRFSAGATEDMLTLSMQTLSHYKDRAFGLLDMAIFKPRFDAEAVERTRAGIASGIKSMEEDPAYLASLHWKGLAFPNHPYGRPRYGTLASVAAVTRDDIKSFIGLHMACDSRIIAVVGDITPKEITRWLDARPQPAACNQRTPAIADISISDGGKAPVLAKLEVPQTVVNASLPGLKREDPRYYAEVLLNQVLGGNTLTARLGKKMRDSRGLAYYAQSDTDAFDHAGFITLRFATRNEQTYAAMDVMREVLRSIATQGVTAQELADAKSYLTGSFPLEIDSEDELTNHLIAMQHYHLGKDYIEKRNVLIDAVTLESVNNLARELLSHPPLVVMAGAPQERKTDHDLQPRH